MTIITIMSCITKCHFRDSKNDKILCPTPNRKHPGDYNSKLTLTQT